MTLHKSKSVPDRLHRCYSIEDHAHSFHNFNTLTLQGQQHLLTFGEYSATSSQSSKTTKQKIIAYFYRNMKSKL